MSVRTGSSSARSILDCSRADGTVVFELQNGFKCAVLKRRKQPSLLNAFSFVSVRASSKNLGSRVASFCNSS